MLWVVSLQTAGKAVSMCPSRIPQRVATGLAPLSAAFRSCPQGRHFRLLCWLWVSLLLCQGPATLQQLARARPRRLHDWSLLPLLRAGYWEAADLWAEWARAVLTTLPIRTLRVCSLALMCTDNGGRAQCLGLRVTVPWAGSGSNIDL